MNTNILGYGSFFPSVDHSDFEEKTTPDFLGEFLFFYAGRPAMKYAIDLISATKKIKTIWLPEYYCSFVKDWLSNIYSTISYYEIDPFNTAAQPDWSLFNNEKDLVIVNNYWGLKKLIVPKGARPVIVEDHSHGWLSKGCVTSEADLCIASLRKTVPIPLGGIFWKPKNSTWKGDLYNPSLFTTPTKLAPMNAAWDLMQGAMEIKAKRSTKNESKAFLEQYAAGEEMVRQNFEIHPVTLEHKKVLQHWYLKDTGSYKRKNIDYSTPFIAASKYFKVLDNKEYTPFGLLLLFKEEQDLKACRKHLISKDIYPAELWTKNTTKYVYRHLLNIHVDFRYQQKDLDYIADSINNWSTH